ncbi:type I restriction enzyme, S subunit [Flavobacterium succinicans]|uniref:Type I restriction enzyme, S subunit n=1 Tax=Flavobacterium succinicans TaxID=29536 RepID=A0A1I4TNH0_9FLAO|nr:restriction endonuclease subunit S [Flavobacterium succinicans]SFM78171.1 type I restriction enzyme, S subunit [Flavobacterium succinicans]
MDTEKFKELFLFGPKSKVKAGDGLKIGRFPFYTSSPTLSKWINTEQYFDEALIFGTGGLPSIHYVNEPFATSTDCLVSIAKPNKSFNVKFVYYYIFTNIRILEQGFKGAGLKHISKPYIQNLDIPLPDLETQDKIVAILDKAKSLIDKREQTIQKFHELLRATFLDMFGDPVKNEKGFELRNLTEFYIDPKNGTKCGPFGSALKIEDYTEDGTPVWNMDNISKNMEFNPKPNLFIPNEKFNELQRYNVVNDDIIISRAGTVGKMCVVKTEFQNSILSTNLIRLRLNSDLLLPKYFIYLMKFSKGGIIRLKKGGEDAFSHMNTGILDSITFPYPQISLQNKFHKIYSKIEASIEKLNQSKTQLENLLNGLSQSAFNGELEFNTAVDLEVLLENDYEYFKDNADKKAIQLLLDRLDKNEVNENKFYEEHLYDKAKSFVFELLKEEKIKQVFDKKTNSIKLTL